jgi:LPXTG-motif cell wall-anchored protein
MERKVVGRTSGKKFLAALLTGLVFFGVIIGAFGFTGTFFAMPLGGMGDFYVTFDKLEGTGFELTPHMGETGNADQVPLVRNRIGSATVENLRIYKDIKLPAGKWIRINIQTERPAKIEGLIQDARFVDADIQFHDLAVKQKNTTGSGEETAYGQNWTQNAESVTITGGKIVTDYLFQNMVSLQNADIWIENIDGPDLSDDESGNIGGAGSGRNGGPPGGETPGSGKLPDTAKNLFFPLMAGTAVIMIALLLFYGRRKGKVLEKS